MICSCGMEMSKNPHPDAGNPTMEGLETGYMWECIPCLVRTRHRWANRAMGAEMREKKLAAALEFYAEPTTYFAIGFLEDPPCGEFADDFEDTDDWGWKPGVRARAALKEWLLP